MYDWWQAVKNMYHWVQSQYWRAVYRWPDRRLQLYGVTGTNGKTTTSLILGSILREAYGAEKVGLLTTIVFWVGGEEVVNETKMTTLDSRLIYRYLRQKQGRGVTQVVLETTSHALHQHRLAGIRFSGVIITNLAREHLDYHQTMAAYAHAKELIVRRLHPQAPLVGKADDKWVGPILTRAQARGVSVHSFTAEQAATVATPLFGSFNQENALAATLLARAVGVREQAIAAGVAAVRAVPGRMEWMESPTGVRVLIDYAVTPDALQQLYAAIRTEVSGRVFGVLGAAGKRDRGKRPAMAKAVAQYVDMLVLTREDPWTEPEEQIFADLEQELDPQCRQPDAETLPATCPSRWQRIVDRREAIRYCLAQAQPGDVVVVTGKGAETGMGIGTRVVPWSERRVVEELFAELSL